MRSIRSASPSSQTELSFPSTEVPATFGDCPRIESIDEAGAMKLLHEPGWCAQEEFDGTRMLLGYRDNEVYAIDRLGRRVTPPAGFILSALAFGPEFLLDGEAVDGIYHAFDLLELAHCDLRLMPFGQRLDVLSDLLHGKDHWAIKQVPTARLRWEKETMFETLRGERRKGIVFKHLEGADHGGSGASIPTARKLTFRPSAVFRVVGYTDGRRIRLERLEATAPDLPELVKVPARHHLPPVGSVVEIAWWRLNVKDVVLDPVFVRRREDLAS